MPTCFGSPRKLSITRAKGISGVVLLVKATSQPLGAVIDSHAIGAVPRVPAHLVPLFHFEAPLGINSIAFFFWLSSAQVPVMQAIVGRFDDAFVLV